MERKDALALLKLNKGAIHPGKGKENAKLVRRICWDLGVDEDDFLPHFVIKNKKGWGLD